MSFLVTTDSGCDLPRALLEEKHIVPFLFSYAVDGEAYRDTMRPEDCHAFYERMRAGAIPKTSQINLQQFMDFWRPLLTQGLPIVHISLGSGVSGTYRNGTLAAQMLMDEVPGAQIHVVDSTLCSTGYGMLALKAAELRDAGSTAAECAAWLRENSIRVDSWFMTDELSYLRRSGRCSRATAAVGSALHIYPIIDFDAAGHLVVQERVRGLEKTLARIHALVGQTVENAAQQTLYICHSDVPRQAQAFGEALQQEFGFRDVCDTYIGTIIGSNCGPGLMAAFYYGKPRTVDGSPGRS